MPLMIAARTVFVALIAAEAARSDSLSEPMKAMAEQRYPGEQKVVQMSKKLCKLMSNDEWVNKG